MDCDLKLFWKSLLEKMSSGTFHSFLLLMFATSLVATIPRNMSQFENRELFGSNAKNQRFPFPLQTQTRDGLVSLMTHAMRVMASKINITISDQIPSKLPLKTTAIQKNKDSINDRVEDKNNYLNTYKDSSDGKFRKHPEKSSISKVNYLFTTHRVFIMLKIYKTGNYFQLQIFCYHL